MKLSNEECITLTPSIKCYISKSKGEESRSSQKDDKSRVDQGIMGAIHRDDMGIDKIYNRQ